MKVIQGKRIGLPPFARGGLAILAAAALVMAACSDGSGSGKTTETVQQPSKNVVALELVRGPLDYSYQGNKPNLDGVILRAHYDDGSTETLTSGFYTDRGRYENAISSDTVNVFHNDCGPFSVRVGIPGVLPLYSLHTNGKIIQPEFFEDDIGNYGRIPSFMGASLGGNYWNGSRLVNADIEFDEQGTFYNWTLDPATNRPTGVTYTVAQNESGNNTSTGIPSTDYPVGTPITFYLPVNDPWEIDRVEYAGGGLRGVIADVDAAAEDDTEFNYGWASLIRSSDIKLNVYYYRRREQRKDPKTITAEDFYRAMVNGYAAVKLAAPEEDETFVARFYKAGESELVLGLQYYDKQIEKVGANTNIPGITTRYPNVATVDVSQFLYTYNGMEWPRKTNTLEHNAQVFPGTHKLDDLLEALWNYYDVNRLYTLGSDTRRVEVTRAEFFAAGRRNEDGSRRDDTYLDSLGLEPGDTESLTLNFYEPRSVQDNFKRYNVTGFNQVGGEIFGVELPFEVTAMNWARN